MTEENKNADEQELTEEQQDEILEADEVMEEVEAMDPEQELAQLRDELAEMRDKLLRVAAEQENVKKRMERDRDTALKYAGEAIFREILPAVDNLERALNHGPMEGADAEATLKGLHEGVELTLKSLLGALDKFEVRPVESIGKPFDPNHQEALTMEVSDSVPANHVSNEFEKGYTYKDRLLRAAKVIVSSGSGE